MIAARAFEAHVVTISMQAKALWGNLSNIISFDISFVLPSISPLFIYALIGAVAVVLLCAFCWLCCTTSSIKIDAIRQGHEVKDWDARVRVACARCTGCNTHTCAAKGRLEDHQSHQIHFDRLHIRVFACESNSLSNHCVRSYNGAYAEGIRKQFSCTDRTRSHSCDCNSLESPTSSAQ